ncbi:MAG: hypothetical protein PHT30_04325, partial [Bacilli bacterium]|nr:hypothetical protein [Bacilli bacterium]
MNDKKNKAAGNDTDFEDKKPEIDFESMSSLANVDVKPISKSTYFFRELGSGLLKFGKWILSFLFDIIKALGNIFVFAYKGLKSLILSIGRLFQKHIRHFQEVDGSGKASYILMGFSSIKNGQIVNGIMYMLSEIIFIVFMIFWGGNNLYKLGGPGYITFQEAYIDPDSGLYVPAQMGDSSIKCLLYGLITVILIFVFIYVYLRNLNVASDNDKITYGLRYAQAYEDKIAFVKNLPSHLDSISTTREVKVNKNGEEVLLSKRVYYSKSIIKQYLQKERGLDKLSVLFISYLPFRLLETKSDEIVEEIAFELNKFHQKYDRFNDYDDVNNKVRHLLFAYENPDLVLDAIYARDKLSQKNNLTPIEPGTKLNKKEAVTRIVGAFEVKAEVAKMIFDIGLHDPKITPEEHRRDYDRLQIRLKRFNEMYPEKYHGRATPFVKQAGALL